MSEHRKPSVTQAARDTWSALARCQTDRYFGKRTKMDKELEVLARFEAEIRQSAEAASRAEVERAWSAYNIAHGQATANGAELAASRAREERLREALKECAVLIAQNHGRKLTDAERSALDNARALLDALIASDGEAQP